MKNLCNFFIFVFLLLLQLESTLPAQDLPEIIKIRQQFKLWQKKLSEIPSSQNKEFFEISLGRNYQESKWINKLDEYDEYFVWSKVTLTKDDMLGITFFIVETSPSGLWTDTAEHYYWPSGELFFFFWQLNTFEADEPLTIERRLYFSKNGEVIKFLESIYKIGTKEKVENPNYMSCDVTYWKNIKKLPFYDLLTKEKKMDNQE